MPKRFPPSERESRSSLYRENEGAVGLLVKGIGQDEKRLYSAFTQVRKREVSGNARRMMARRAIRAEFPLARRFHDFL
jgi:hypothetical protein